jgi:5-methyltetrahydrofolate--homocysteine methyltransferase
VETLKQVREQLYEGNAESVSALVQQALDDGLSPGEVLETGLLAGMTKVGADFRDDILFIPEVLRTARAMHAGMDVLRPLLVGSGVEPVGKFMIGTVKGDLHDIGKNLVGMVMEGAGFEVLDLGMDTPAEKFVAEVEKHQPELLGLSALLTSTMMEMREVIEALENAGLRNSVKVMVGGAPVTEKYAEGIGADGFAANAPLAADKAKELLGLS